MNKLRIVGLSSIAPEVFITNEQIEKIVGYPKAKRICDEVLGIKTRGFFCPINIEHGKSISITDMEIDLAEKVAHEALADANIDIKNVELLIVASCTVQHRHLAHFSGFTYQLFGRLGLPETTISIELDEGCGGFIKALHLINKKFVLSPGSAAVIILTSMPGGFNSEVQLL